MALKLDMANPFDRVEWNFLKRVMEKFQFTPNFTNLIMSFISTTSFTFSINQQLNGSVTPSLGICQGDPLSPYLFLLCFEGLSSLITQHVHQRIPQKHALGLKISWNEPIISNLFFADDSILFSAVSPNAAAQIKDILHTYSLASGQLVNYDKSSLYFSPNTTASVKDQITPWLKVPIRTSIEKYLGLPQSFGRSKKEAFVYLQDRVWTHLNRWNSTFFSKGGKEILLKSVVQAIPSDAMTCFKLPHYFHQKVESMMAQFWWGGTNQSRKIHWKSLSSLCKSKFHGGLGFRFMKAFNQALLAKQAWRILQALSSLVAQLLKARYYPHSSFLDSSRGHRPSLVWNSISWGKTLL
uniref:Reverse transcriptase domain-containing protein n=1 Tax=Cannabis sativa TaxID=3483 RepID=A0A803P9D6_CANSA